MPYRISRLGYVGIRSLDLDRDLEHSVDVLGLHLSGRDVPERVHIGLTSRRAGPIRARPGDARANRDDGREPLSQDK